MREKIHSRYLRFHAVTCDASRTMRVVLALLLAIDVTQAWAPSGAAAPCRGSPSPSAACRASVVAAAKKKATQKATMLDVSKGEIGDSYRRGSFGTAVGPELMNTACSGAPFHRLMMSAV